MDKLLLNILIAISILLQSTPIKAENILQYDSDYGKTIIISTHPRNKSTEIDTDSKIKIKFNNNIYWSEGNISIYNEDKSILEIFNKDSERVYIEANKLTIEPTNSFKHGEKYYVYISANAIKSINGLFIKGIDKTKWSFTCINNSSTPNIFEIQKPLFYPNPAINTIYFKNFESLNCIKIINLTGRCVLDIKPPFTSASLNNIPKGMYFVNYFLNNGSIQTDKLLKK